MTTTLSKTVRGAGITLALGLALVCGVAGCSSGAGDSDAGSAASSALDSSGGSSGDSAAAAPKSASRAFGATSVTVTDASSQKQIRTAQVTLRVTGIDDAAARVRTIATGVGGLVQDENTTFGSAAGTGAKKAAKGSSVLTLRVPADQLDTAIDRLGDIGRRLDLRTTSKDVTTTVADLDSRVLSQERSVDRMRALLDKAGSVKDIIAIESQLGSREADLESLQAQALAVKDQVALSTLVVTLKPTAAAAPAPKDDDDGFLAGLSTGWDFVRKSGVVALTVIGTLLPLGVVIAVVAVPAWFLYRRFGAPSLKPAAKRP